VERGENRTNTHLIDFESLPWTQPQKGLQYKLYKNGTQQLRLAEFSEEFNEKDWCCRGHAGYVLHGGCLVDFNGSLERFCSGDAFFIPEGGDHKHKLIVEKGQKAVILLFELL
jgi:hypothetical protein